MSKQALPEEIDKMLLMNTIERPSMLSPRLDSLGQPLDVSKIIICLAIGIE